MMISFEKILELGIKKLISFFLDNFVSAVSPAKLVDVISSVKLLNETVAGKNGFPRHI